TVILSTGRGYSNEYKAFDDTVKIFSDIGIASEVGGKLIIREYLDNIDEIYSIADLVISRAGAGTIKEITTLGLPSIIIPKIDLPGDHQILNAREVQKIGGAKIVYETVKYENNQRTIYVPETDLLDTIRKTIFDGDDLFNMRKNLRQIEKQNSTELILKELEQLLEGKRKSEEEQLKVFYLQAEEGEKNIELIFDSTSIGNSYLCDAPLEGVDAETLIELKIINKGEKILVHRLKGAAEVDGGDVKKLAEIKEDSQLKVGDKTFTLKSYLEKVEKVQVEKSTTAKVLGSSFGIMLSRIDGLFRMMVIAAYFGTGRAADIYVVGLTIANLMRRVVAENALENAFLPIFSRIFHRVSRKKTWEAAASIINFTVAISLLFTVLGILLAPVIIDLCFPGLAEKGMVRETVNLTRLILPYLFLVTVAAVMTTYLKAFNSFGIAESSFIFFSVGTILGIWLLYPVAGLYSLAYGVLAGGVLQILFLFPFVLKILRMKSMQFFYKPIINFDSPTNRKYYSQLGPISLDVFLAKVSEVVGKSLASGLADGSIAFLHYSLIIFQLPFAVISQAINSVVLKEFSQQIALFDKEKAKRLFMDGIKTNIFLLTPVSVLLIVLARPIVSILLERGIFTGGSATNTAYALQFYALGLVGWGIHSLTVRIFAARIDIKTSMILNFFMLLVNIVLCFLLVKTPLKFAGVALATSISFVFFSFIRVVVLKIKLGREHIAIKYKELLTPFGKTLVSTIFMVIGLLEARFIFEGIDFNSRFAGNIVSLISLTFIGISIYLLSSLMLKNTELLIFRKKLTRKSPSVPVSMLSPFRFLEKVSRNVDTYKDDYFYKINIYLSGSRWEIRNVGVKLVGLFKDKSKADYLLDILRSKKENGFIKRNALTSLKQLNIWNSEIKKLLLKLLSDGYYEVRAAALEYMTQGSTHADYDSYREILPKRLKKATIEEKLAILRLIAKTADKDALHLVERLYLDSNSLVREELLQLLHSFHRRKLLTADETRLEVQKILITSNNLSPEFRLKAIIKKIYKEIE
ncbi:MAG: murein biosynthesis integral membrane protein MurJ, partial [bacterium]|nr:murein biosynthesis integral membrane protein MurJ [bacterium]